MSIILIFFFNVTATTKIYYLSLHDALPISIGMATVTWQRFSTGILSTASMPRPKTCLMCCRSATDVESPGGVLRSEEHTSELQSRRDLVCRLLLEKKKKLIKCIVLFGMSCL